jgi:hypothetical protein
MKYCASTRDERFADSAFFAADQMNIGHELPRLSFPRQITTAGIPYAAAPE